MANRHLTQRRIDSFRPGRSVREFRDTDLQGFGIWCLSTGRKQFFIHTRQDGKWIWKTIGDAAMMPLVEARALARPHLAEFRGGEPSCGDDGKADTAFEEVADAVFCRHALLQKPGTLEVNHRYLKNQILPRFRGQSIGDISNRDVRQWFASLHATPAAADRAAPILSVIMREAEFLGCRLEGSNSCRNIRRYRRRGAGTL